jgi:hypothetical protein
MKLAVFEVGMSRTCRRSFLVGCDMLILSVTLFKRNDRNCTTSKIIPSLSAALCSKIKEKD